MSNQNNGVKNLIEAHSWLGVIVSVALFIVFWAGSIVLFVPELYSWAETPSHPVDRSAEDLPLEAIVGDILADYPLDNEEHLTILRANEHRPYHQIYVDLKSEKGAGAAGRVAELKVDPKTGQIVGDLRQFNLVEFLYELHYDLHLPGGLYLVGFATLVFLILIFSGVWIHARKIFRNFFLYRKDKKRSKLLDIHNVVGVMSLPFTLMYAVTGLIFNLSIVYQIAFAVFLYQGNSQALLADAGYAEITREPRGVPMDMSASWQFVSRLEADIGRPIGLVRFYNYGDENAVLEIRADDDERFADRTQLYYTLKDRTPIVGMNAQQDNAVRQGLDAVAALHFGSFAGLDVRILYFVLGMGVAGMIVVGNLLWIDKRRKQRNVGPGTIRFFSRLTLGGCCGTVVATAAVFLAERVLPLGLAARGDWIGRIFFVVLALFIAAAYVLGDGRKLLRAGLLVAAALAVSTVAADWLMYGGRMGGLWSQGYEAIVGVEVGLLAAAALCVWIVRMLRAGRRPADARTATRSKLSRDSRV